jgi:hypothetical protein
MAKNDKSIKILNDITVGFSNPNSIIIPKDTIIKAYNYILIKENIPEKSWETPKEHYHSIEIEIHVDIIAYKLQIWKSDFEWIE